MDDNFKYLNCLVAATSFLEMIDALEGKYFKRELKMYANKLRDELIKVLDSDMPVLVAADGDGCLNDLLVSHENILKTIAGVNPNHLTVISTILDLYNQNPEDVCEKLSMKLISRGAVNEGGELN